MLKIALDSEGMSAIPLDELLQMNPDSYALLFAIVGLGGSPELAGLITERDPAAGRKLIARLDDAMSRDHRGCNHPHLNSYKGPVFSGIARAEAHRLLMELE